LDDVSLACLTRLFHSSISPNERLLFVEGPACASTKRGGEGDTCLRSESLSKVSPPVLDKSVSLHSTVFSHLRLVSLHGVGSFSLTQGIFGRIPCLFRL